MTTKTLILGLGNRLLADEAAGPEAVGRLGAELGSLSHPDGIVELMDGGTLSFTLAGPIGDCDRLIVVDAAVMGDAPGSVRVFEGESMDRQLAQHANSVHEVSLSDLMDMARLTDTLPDRRALVGIEPELVDWGDRLSPSVETAIPEAMARIRELLKRWDSPTEPT